MGACQNKTKAAKLADLRKNYSQNITFKQALKNKVKEEKKKAENKELELLLASPRKTLGR